MTWAQGKNMGPQEKSTRVQAANTKSLLTFSFNTDTDEVSGVTWNGSQCRIWWKWHVIVDSTTQQMLSDLWIQSRINRLWQRHVLQSIDFACPFAVGQMELFGTFIHSIVIMWACSQHYLSQSIFPPPVLVLETSWLPFTEGEGKIGSLSVTLSLSRSQQMSTPAECPLRPADYASLPPIPRLLQPHSPAEGQRASPTEGQQEWDLPWDRCRRGLRRCIKT